MMLHKRRDFLQGAGIAAAGLLSLRGLSAAVQTATTPGQRPRLKITDVRTARAQGMHVRIYTDQGLVGEGEAVDAISGAQQIVAGFRGSLMGQDPLRVEAIWERIRTSGIFGGAQAGQYVTALTAVEIALWDLTGKALGVPIYQLLGGKTRERVRVYCDSGTNNRADPRAKEFISQIIDMGFTAAKIDIDDGGDPSRFDRVNWTANNAEIDHMIDKVAFVREALPKTIELAVDMHGRYDLGTAKRMAKELEPFRLLWLEEPVPPDNVDAMRDVRQSCHTPICCGENLFLRHGFRELLEKNAVDIIMPDIQKCGGLLEARKIADMAHTYYVPLAPHCQASPIGTMASCHVMAAIPNALVIEWHWGHPADRMVRWKNFVKQGDIIQKGYITVSDRPGIGLDIDDEAVGKTARGGWFTAA
ncbi:MAG: Mandelate racemase/muconate lactonizing enzyme, C-terminal domain protein [candidate division NC10 bacterium]|nr:Mandelate racemase/muconate lactonizing enzyme, C-terminal domain protein [candidate division NC10 bacterium]